MTVFQKSFQLKTKPYCDVIDISSQVQSVIKESNIHNGIVNVHIAGSTGAISTTEYEPGLVKHDIEDFLGDMISPK